MDESNGARAAIGNVDACSALRTGISVNEAAVARGDMIVLRGWIAAPDASPDEARNVWIEIDDSDSGCALRGDVERADVAATFDSERLRFCGIVAVIATETLEVDSHTITVFVSGADDSVFALPSRVFDVVAAPHADGAAASGLTRFAGRIDEWTIASRDNGNALAVGGWAFDLIANVPVTDVFLPLHGKRASVAVVGFPRYDVAWSFEDDTLVACGFRLYSSAADEAEFATGGLALASIATSEIGWLSREVDVRSAEVRACGAAKNWLEAAILADILELDRLRDDAEAGERFDARFGVDTEAPMFFAPADIHEADPDHSRHYEAVPMRMIDDALDSVPFDPRGATFVDFGCGKGRALIAAARQPFAAVVGVELSPTLAALARANIDRIDRTLLRCASLEIVEANAAEYELPAGDIVAFLYNPFDATVLEPILDRLASTACERVAIIYAYPVHGDAIEAHGAFARVATFAGGAVFERRSAAIDVALPAEFDLEAYRGANRDLRDLGDDDLASHYAAAGEAEGRRANFVVSRDAFAALVPNDADALEIGPYHSPLLRGARTKYFDVLTRDAMLERAAADGIDGSGAPAIDFVSPTGDLGIVDARFDVVLSSHALEHQPDLISHLQSVERLLRPGGRYFVIVPDKRYCFDHFSAESGLAEIVEAYVERRTAHTLRSVLGQSVMSTHNDCARHWNGDHGNFLEAPGLRIQAGIDAYASSHGAYVDVHAWYFTPASARAVFGALGDAGYTSLAVERIYPTRRDAFEFWFVLRKMG